MNLMSVIEKYSDDAACRDLLEDLRWPNGIACPKCGGTSVYRLEARHQIECNDRSCKYRFSATSGTIFHDSKLPLRKWLLAVYIITESKKGISSNQLARMLNTTVKTAWYLSHRIREALKLDNPRQLTGTVETDETYIGGEVRGKGKGFVDNKTIVLGAKERGGELRMEAGPNKSKATIRGFIKRTVSPDAEAIYTDDSNSYGDLSDANTRHETVAHRLEEWVRGDVSTNSIEGEWSLFNRGLVGAFHHVSPKHLDRYLDEFEFRANNRGNPHIFRDAVRELVLSGNLEYKTLTA
jgi:transposase-like protein